MKRKIAIFLQVMLLSIISMGVCQAQEKRMDMEQFQKLRNQYITEKAELTADEAAKFLPLHNELTQKKFELRRQLRAKSQQLQKGKVSDDEYRKLMNKEAEIKIKEAELDKTYAEKFEKVLSAEKLFKAQQAARDFTQQQVQKYRSARAKSAK